MSHPLFNLFYFFKGRSSQNDLSKLNKVSTGTVAALTVRVVVSGICLAVKLFHKSQIEATRKMEEALLTRFIVENSNPVIGTPSVVHLIGTSNRLDILRISAFASSVVAASFFGSSYFVRSYASMIAFNFCEYWRSVA